MIIGVPKEIKSEEYRVGLTPHAVHELVLHGHRLLVERGAGLGSGFGDEDYQRAGATLIDSAAEIWAHAALIVKVKEPQPGEYGLLRPGQLLFTYLHLAPDPILTQALLDSGASCIAYETVTSPSGQLPLLTPMSEVAGRLAIQAGAHCLEKSQGGRGVLLAGVPGVKPARVVILGGGVVGSSAALIALGMGAAVTLLDRSVERLRQLEQQFGGHLDTCYATTQNIEREVVSADLVIGAVLVPGARAPRLISRALLGSLNPGAVLVDVSIDQGGCFESSRPTSHRAPTYVEQGVVHYCVANMPSAVARTASLALNNATLPYVLELADAGLTAALTRNRWLRAGLNVHQGQLTCQAVAEAQGRDYCAADTLFAA